MPLDYNHLDERTRALMLAEIERDIVAGVLYLSDNLSPLGCRSYPDLLRKAALSGNDDSLAADIRNCLNSHEKPRHLASGGFSKAPIMRNNAHEMLAEGEFNRFYMRGICLRAIEDGVDQLIVYRAKEVMNARSASVQKVGQSISTQALLNDLRTHTGVDTALGLPPGPNSGLCIRLP
jgi:hypothetical protein